MIYTVAWLRSAENELADLWVATSDRKAVTAAANTIDRMLRTDADTCGQPFFGHRLLVVPPLSVIVTVSRDDRMVTVVQLQYIDP